VLSKDGVHSLCEWEEEEALGDKRMAQTVQIEEDEEDEAFLRRLVLPEEDRRRLYPTMPWTGGWRWFRSANIVCIEQWRRKKAQGKRTQAGGCGRAG
jgi:hypothetical protein